MWQTGGRIPKDNFIQKLLSDITTLQRYTFDELQTDNHLAFTTQRYT